MALLPPTVDQQRRIDKILPPDAEMRKRDIIALKDWLSKQPHLPKHMDDKRLEHFLFGCKNSIERCKLILETYYSVRTELTEFFSNRDPLARDIQENCDVVEYFVLPKLTDEGHRVTILRLKETALERFSLTAITRRILMVLDIRLQEEASLTNIMIFDLKGFTAGHFAKCVPTQTIVKKAMLATQNSMPFRLHRIHYVNAPNFIGSILNIFNPLLKEKLVEKGTVVILTASSTVKIDAKVSYIARKFRVHTGAGEELHPYMDKDILPNEYGGKAGTFQELNESWRLKIEKYRDWFLREEKLGRTNESARLPASKSLIVKELDGVQGSFRKLNID